MQKKDFPRKHDTILRYTKTENFDFNQQYVPYKKSVKAAKNDSSFTVKDKEAQLARLEELDVRGKPVEDYWVDFDKINPMAKERLGYPTQKPEKLLERIILASSNTNTI